ncbi:expressed protein [Phakopsora pachyrhizi]|uniref:Expressed protein n=1 Tax=Phakopsora pachyrhizi TaxID=170000 RepID=A0AAV0BEE2_PHAPC|nr:expressed protein [Phakopsora pachyrhizi]
MPIPLKASDSRKDISTPTAEQQPEPELMPAPVSNLTTTTNEQPKNNEENLLVDQQSEKPWPKQLPLLPPKTWDEYPKLPITNHPRTPNSTKLLVRFLIGLSNLTFFAGSFAGIVAVFYQRYLFPKLSAARERLLSLNFSALESQEKLFKELRSLVQWYPELFRSATKCIDFIDNKGSEGIKYKNEKPEFFDKLKEESFNESNDLKIQDQKSLTSSESVSPEFSRKEENHSTLDDCAKSNHSLNKSTNESVNRLAEALQRRENSRLEKGLESQVEYSRAKIFSDSLKSIRLKLYSSTDHLFLTNYSRSGNSYFTQKSLMNSLSASDLELEQTDGQGKNHNLQDHTKALSDFKREVRSMKGMLLNRRNFSS